MSLLRRLLPRFALAVTVAVGVSAVGCATAGARLIRAIEAHDKAAIEAALQSGEIDINEWVELGRNSGLRPLQAAVYEGDVEIARMLLDAGADPNRVDNEDPPLTLAAARKDLAMVELLLERGADARVNDHGETPLRELFRAGSCRSEENKPMLAPIAEALLRAGADPNFYDGYGLPPLHRAIECRDEASLTVLLAHRADLNLTDSTGRTAVVFAAEVSVGLMALLIEAGADSTPVCQAIAGSMRDDPQGDERMRYLAARGDSCAEFQLGYQERGRKYDAREAAAAAAAAAARKEEEPAAPAAAAPVARDEPPPSARCSGNQTSCGTYCCGSGTTCCVPDGSRNRQGGMCLALPTGRGCPWGMHQERF